MRKTVNGINMYYEVHGGGEPVVLLHGAYLLRKAFQQLRDYSEVSSRLLADLGREPRDAQAKFDLALATSIDNAPANARSANSSRILRAGNCMVRTCPDGWFTSDLDTAHHEQDNHDQKHEPKAAAGVITPSAAIAPSR